jgi:hypothetical protein
MYPESEYGSTLSVEDLQRCLLVKIVYKSSGSYVGLLDLCLACEDI